MAVLQSCARATVRRYPRRWRDRYEAEVLGLLDDGGATWRHVLDLIVGCGSEWVQMLLRPEPDRAFRHQAAILIAVLLIGLVVDLAALGATRLWHLASSWAPPSSISSISRGIPPVTLIAVLLSMFGSRRARVRTAWMAVVLTLGGAVLDRFGDEPTGIGYGIKSVFWVAIVLTWDDFRSGPYRSRPPLGLSS